MLRNTIRLAPAALAEASQSDEISPHAFSSDEPLIERRWRQLHSQTISMRRELDQLRVQNRTLRRLIFTDPLTGLCNRIALEKALLPKWASFEEGAVIVLDLDRFKTVNDTYGHEMGDRILARFGELIRMNIREEDFAVRYGGEEFVVLACGVMSRDAAVIAERIRRATERFIFPAGIRMTVSIGLAAGSPPAWKELFPKADESLYAAKSAGRNRVICRDPIGMSSRLHRVEPAHVQ